MNKEYILDSLTEMIPNPKCELNYTSDYTLLIAILLSAQTLDKNVNKITPILFSKYPTLEDFKNAELTRKNNSSPWTKQKQVKIHQKSCHRFN